MRSLLLPVLLLPAVGLVQAGAPARYGAPLPDTAALPLSEALAAFDQHAAKPLRYSGRITQVCQAEGVEIEATPAS